MTNTVIPWQTIAEGERLTNLDNWLELVGAMVMAQKWVDADAVCSQIMVALDAWGGFPIKKHAVLTMKSACCAGLGRANDAVVAAEAARQVIQEMGLVSDLPEQGKNIEKAIKKQKENDKSE